MKALNRLKNVILFIVLIPMVIPEVIFYGLRWIVIGKEFPIAPICVKYIVTPDVWKELNEEDVY